MGNSQQRAVILEPPPNRAKKPHQATTHQFQQRKGNVYPEILRKTFYKEANMQFSITLSYVGKVRL